jgi:hypothetical protein
LKQGEERMSEIANILSVIDVYRAELGAGTSDGPISDALLAQMVYTMNDELGLNNKEMKSMTETILAAMQSMGMDQTQAQDWWTRISQEAATTGLDGDALAKLIEYLFQRAAAFKYERIKEDPIESFMSYLDTLRDESSSTEEAIEKMMEFDYAMMNHIAAANGVVSEREVNMLNKFSATGDALIGAIKLLTAAIAVTNEQAERNAQVSSSGQSESPTDWHRGGVVYAHNGYLARDEVPAVLLTGEGVLNRKAMMNLGVNNFRLLNSGVSLEEISAMSYKRYNNISTGATTGLPPIIHDDDSSSDNSTSEDSRVTTYSNDNRLVVQFNNCRFERGVTPDEIEDHLVSKWRNRTGALQGVIRNNLDNRTSRNN